jgi:hypothetical protein
MTTMRARTNENDMQKEEPLLGWEAVRQAVTYALECMGADVGTSNCHGQGSFLELQSITSRVAFRRSCEQTNTPESKGMHAHHHHHTHRV